MRSPLFMIVLCLLSIKPPQTPVQDQQTEGHDQKVFTAEDFKNRTANPKHGSEPVTFLIQINRKLPPYKIQVTPNLNDHRSGGSGPWLDHVGRIVISSQKPSSKAQVIEVKTFAGSDMFVRFFKAEDINFDGYLDIAVVNDYGAKWGRYKYWLFDKKSGRFVTNRLTRKLGRLSYNTIDLNSNDKRIKIGFFYGVCPQSRTYRILKGELVLTEIEERECEMNGAKVLIKRPINGKLIPVKTRFEKW
jgi:hypothetical protein